MPPARITGKNLSLVVFIIAIRILPELCEFRKTRNHAICDIKLTFITSKIYLNAEYCTTVSFYYGTICCCELRRVAALFGCSRMPISKCRFIIVVTI